MVASLATVVLIPTPSNCAFVPVPIWVVHEALLYISKVTVSAELEPITSGLVSLLLGLAGLVEEKVGSVGEILSWV